MYILSMSVESINQKQHVRERALARRRQLTPQKRFSSSQTIISSLCKRKEFIEASSICIYVSFETEVATHDCIKDLLLLEKKVIVPKIHDNTLSLYYLHQWSDLLQGSFHIFEPNSNSTIAPLHLVDLFVIPGIAFDIHGHRIGWGKGYYDKLLRGIQVPKIGLAFSEQIFPLLPFESYDIVMDAVITEKEIFEM